MFHDTPHRGRRSHTRRLFEHLWLAAEGPKSGGRRHRRRGSGGGRGGPLGGRRPLRFLARKLDLNDEQFAQLAVLFSEIKTERAQASVDRRRSAALYADAFGKESFDQTKANEAKSIATAAQARLNEQIAKSLARVHQILDEKQRSKLACILRELPTGLF